MFEHDYSPTREQTIRWRSRNEGMSERWKMQEGENDRWQKRDTIERNRNSDDRSLTRDRSPHRKGKERAFMDGRRNVRNDRMVYISNIPYDVRWMELKDLIREKAGEVNFVEILEDRNGKSKGSAVVEFREKESVERCVEALHRFVMNDRMLTAKEIRDPVAFFRKVKDDTGIDFLNGLHGAPVDTRARRDESFETYGLSPAFLHQLNIDGSLTNRVFVSNLPYNLQSGRLYDIFSLAGKVTWVDLHLDKEGHSKGMAVVQYSHPIEAVQAISMLNNQRVFDRLMNVKMDRFDPVDEKREGDLPIGLRSIGMGLGANGAPLGDVSSIISSLSSSSGAVDHSSTHYVSGQSGYQTASSPAFQSAGIASALPFASSNYTSTASPFAAASNATFGSGSFGGYGGGYSGHRSIIIKNLPLDYTWQIVRDRVQQFGPVDHAEMIAPGCAKVSFASSSDAERARKALQNTTVEGRLIGVEFLA